jgi:rhomboid protease GluP
MCRSCGSIVGAGETQCAVCGASNGPQLAAESHQSAADSENVRFARAILDRPYKFTLACFVLNLFVFLLMWQSSGLSFGVLSHGFPEPVLISYGAMLNALIRPPNHQWWRLVTAIFVHNNIYHLLMNMFSLLILGLFVEKLYGSAKFVVFLMVSGIAGSLASYLTLRPALAHGLLGTFIFRSDDVTAAGASGALFGLVGVLFVFGIKFRRELPEGFKRAFGTGLLPVILINLFIGFLGRSFIGNAAHLAGLLSGAALALFVDYRRPDVRASINTAWRALQILLLAVIALGAYKVIKNFNHPVPALAVARPEAKEATFRNYVKAMNEVQEKASAIIHKDDLTDLEPITQRALQAPVPDARAAELRIQLLQILSKLAVAASSSASPQPKAEPGRPPQLDQKLVDDFKNWRKEYDVWLKGAARTYTGLS